MQSRNLAVSGCECVKERERQCIYNLWQFPSRGQDSLGDSQEITPCSHIIPSFLSLLSHPLPHHFPPPPLHLTQLLHCYMPAKCYSGPVFEKPFHFSLLSGSCCNGLLSFHMVSSVIHIQSNTCWPSATSDSGCNYDRPNALPNCTSSLLLAEPCAVLHVHCSVNQHVQDQI